MQVYLEGRPNILHSNREVQCGLAANWEVPSDEKNSYFDSSVKFPFKSFLLNTVFRATVVDTPHPPPPHLPPGCRGPAIFVFYTVRTNIIEEYCYSITRHI
jgi:hypothetical protein